MPNKWKKKRPNRARNAALRRGDIKHCGRCRAGFLANGNACEYCDGSGYVRNENLIPVQTPRPEDFSFSLRETALNVPERTFTGSTNPNLMSTHVESVTRSIMEQRQNVVSAVLNGYPLNTALPNVYTPPHPGQALYFNEDGQLVTRAPNRNARPIGTVVDVNQDTVEVSISAIQNLVNVPFERVYNTLGQVHFPAGLDVDHVTSSESPRYGMVGTVPLPPPPKHPLETVSKLTWVKNNNYYQFKFCETRDGPHVWWWSSHILGV